MRDQPTYRDDQGSGCRTAHSIAREPRASAHLARPLEIERTWGDARATPTDALDRFESAVAFAMREATRLHRDSKSRAIAVSRIEVPER
jgi:hypothetical protein